MWYFDLSADFQHQRSCEIENISSTTSPTTEALPRDSITRNISADYYEPCFHPCLQNSNYLRDQFYPCNTAEAHSNVLDGPFCEGWVF